MWKIPLYVAIAVGFACSPLCTCLENKISNLINKINYYTHTNFDKALISYDDFAKIVQKKTDNMRIWFQEYNLEVEVKEENDSEYYVAWFKNYEEFKKYQGFLKDFKEKQEKEAGERFRKAFNYAWSNEKNKEKTL